MLARIPFSEVNNVYSPEANMALVRYNGKNVWVRINASPLKDLSMNHRTHEVDYIPINDQGDNVIADGDTLPGAGRIVYKDEVIQPIPIRKTFIPSMFGGDIGTPMAAIGDPKQGMIFGSKGQEVNAGDAVRATDGEKKRTIESDKTVKQTIDPNQELGSVLQDSTLLKPVPSTAFTWNPAMLLNIPAILGILERTAQIVETGKRLYNASQLGSGGVGSA